MTPLLFLALVVGWRRRRGRLIPLPARLLPRRGPPGPHAAISAAARRHHAGDGQQVFLENHAQPCRYRTPPPHRRRVRATRTVRWRCWRAGPMIRPGSATSIGIRTFCLYAQKGRIWIRQRKAPLTPEQSACLTEFALAQEGKPFALGRLARTAVRLPQPRAAPDGMEGKAIRPGPLCLLLLRVGDGGTGGGRGDRCGNRPTVGDVPAGHFFRLVAQPVSQRHFDLSGCWYPPARFTGCPGGCAADGPPAGAAPPADMPAPRPAASGGCESTAHQVRLGTEPLRRQIDPLFQRHCRRPTQFARSPDSGRSAGHTSR